MGDGILDNPYALKYVQLLPFVVISRQGEALGTIWEEGYDAADRMAVALYGKRAFAWPASEKPAHWERALHREMIATHHERKAEASMARRLTIKRNLWTAILDALRRTP